MRFVTSMVVFAIASEPAPAPGTLNDDRAWGSAADGLFAVADASGPTYGGYHRPSAVDLGWQQLLDGWRSTRGDLQQRLVRAVAHANAAMVRRGRGWESRSRAVIVEGRADELSHPTASMTIVGCDAREVVVTQVGSTRGYRMDGTHSELLLPDHTLATVMAQESPEIAIEPEHEAIVTRRLGHDLHLHTEFRRFPWAPGVSIALCTDGLWRGFGPDALDGVARRARNPATMVRELLAAAAPTGDARTALALAFPA